MKRIVLALVAAAALAAPASALAGGVVVKVERGSHLVAVASAQHVSLLHTRAQLRVGERITMHAQKLRNGTFAASRVRVVGRAARVGFRGLLLARNRADHSITVSAGGAPITVTSTSTPSSAQPGSEVEVEADVTDTGDLEANDVTVVSATAPGGSLEGHLLAIGTSSITVGSDHQTLVINVPPGFDLSKFTVGDEVLAVFTQQSDGTLLLTSLSGDQNAQQANEQEDNQGGDDGNATGGQGDNGGSTGSTDSGSGDGGSNSSGSGDGGGSDGGSGGGGND